MAVLPSFVTDYRAIAREILLYLGGDVEPWGNEPGETSSQRQTTDAVYFRGLVESRVYKPPSSSCGDAPHCLYYRLGVRLVWVNREEFQGWTYIGARNNITRLTAKAKYGTNALAKVSTSEDIFGCGDVLIVNVHDPNTTHAICVIEHRPEDGTILTMESGQPGAAIRLRTCVPDRGRWRIGKRHVDSWLPLDSVILAAHEADQLSICQTADIWATEANLPQAGVFYSGMRSRTIRRAQERLAELGFRVGTPDGVFGPATLSALRSYQADSGLVVSSQLDQLTISALG